MTIAERLRQEGEQSKALHIAKIMLESGVPLTDIMRFTGVSEEELAAASRHFKSCLHPLLQRHQQVTKLDRMRNKRRMGRFGEDI